MFFVQLALGQGTLPSSSPGSGGSCGFENDDVSFGAFFIALATFWDLDLTLVLLLVGTSD